MHPCVLLASMYRSFQRRAGCHITFCFCKTAAFIPNSFMKAMLEKHTNYLAIIELLSKFVYLSLIPFGKGDLSIAFLLMLSCFTHQTI